MTHTTDAPESHLAGTWKVEPARSKVEFSMRQFVGRTRGRFTDFDATIVVGEDLSDSSVSARISLASVDTGNAKRDGHLAGPKYFDVDRRPTATYQSRGLRSTDQGTVIIGELTLFGVTASVPLLLSSKGFTTDTNGRRRAVFTASAEISRRTFGITIPMDGGGRIFSDSLAIAIEVVAVPA